DGRHIGAVLHNGECETGIDPPPVQQHGARAALAMIAALLRAGQVEMVAQRIEQGGPRREFELRLDAVDDQRYWNLVWRWDNTHAPLRRVRARHLHLRMS